MRRIIYPHGVSYITNWFYYFEILIIAIINIIVFGFYMGYMYSLVSH